MVGRDYPGVSSLLQIITGNSLDPLHRQSFQKECKLKGWNFSIPCSYNYSTWDLPWTGCHYFEIHLTWVLTILYLLLMMRESS